MIKPDFLLCLKPSVLKEQNIPHGMIQFVITVGEESGLVGAKALDLHLLKAKYGYALDSDGLVGNIVVAAPTQAKSKSYYLRKNSSCWCSTRKRGFRDYDCCEIILQECH